jgi:hypothetical protein
LEYETCLPVYNTPSNGVELDEDGDMVVSRNDSFGEPIIVLRVAHAVDTELSHVGLQLWPGALLLAEFIFYCQNEFSGRGALEVGAGLGLCSMFLHGIGANVIVTDYLNEVLEGCRLNFARNIPFSFSAKVAKTLLFLLFIYLFYFIYLFIYLFIYSFIYLLFIIIIYLL